MNWNLHLDLRDKHAFLSPSKPSWINYDPSKLETVYINHRLSAIGTRVHLFAKEAIEMKIRLPITPSTLNMFVNDAIGFRMTSEQTLYYSQNAFGCADAICFSDQVLRIHDLKTGVTPGKLPQIEIYSALFCLEYHEDPFKMDFILRIYQEDEVVEWYPTSDTIRDIMETIIKHDKLIEAIKAGRGVS